MQALDTLGSTKWRVNKRILSVVESIWAGGGNIAGLVDRKDVRNTSDATLSKNEKNCFCLFFRF